MRVTYSSNNSGGGWWLTDEDWYALEKAGWVVDWVKDKPSRLSFMSTDGRWLGALATEASREGLSLDAAMTEWETITGENAHDQGCECCGEPHYFRGVDS